MKTIMKTIIKQPYISGTENFEYLAEKIVIEWDVTMDNFDNHVLIKPVLKSATLHSVEIYDILKDDLIPIIESDFEVDKSKMVIDDISKEDSYHAINLQLDDATIVFNNNEISKVSIDFLI